LLRNSARRGAGDRDRRLPHASGSGVNQHPVTGGDPCLIVEAVPGDGVSGAHGGRLTVGKAWRQRYGKAGVTRHVRCPATVHGIAADTVAHPMSRHVGTDRGDDPGEIHTELRRIAVDAGVATGGVEHVGEIEAGRRYRDLDFPAYRRHAVERGQFHRLQITGRADLPTHAITRMIRHGGSPLLGT
jgi:hypothetical protein